MSSGKESNRYCEAGTKADCRSCGGRRRAEAVRPKTEVAVDLLKQSVSAGICADYVLMDPRFTTESFIQKIKALGLDVIGMVKQLKQSYTYQGQGTDL